MPKERHLLLHNYAVSENMQVWGVGRTPLPFSNLKPYHATAGLAEGLVLQPGPGAKDSWHPSLAQGL